MSGSLELGDLVKAAREAALTAKEAERLLGAYLMKLARSMLPSGRIVDGRDKHKLPEHLRDIHVRAGNAHGTRVFKFWRVRHVVVDPVNVALSTWCCDAVAINEKTGKMMNGKMKGHHLSEMTGLVTLEGHFVQTCYSEEPVEEANARMLDSLPEPGRFRKD